MTTTSPTRPGEEPSVDGPTGPLAVERDVIRRGLTRRDRQLKLMVIGTRSRRRPPALRPTVGTETAFSRLVIDSR
jgi:hypothetical protein